MPFSKQKQVYNIVLLDPSIILDSDTNAWKEWFICISRCIYTNVNSYIVYWKHWS